MLCHESVTGITRSGKTYYAADRAAGHRGPVLIVDPQEDPAFNRWPRSDGACDWADVWAQARRGGVAFVPSENDRLATAQVAWMLSGIVTRAPAPEGYRPPVLVVVDEAHIYAPEGSPPGGLHHIARRGLRWGVMLCVVSQRPQDVAKAVLQQCSRHVIFRAEMLTPYWARYGIPADQVQAALDRGRELYAHRQVGEPPGPRPYVVWEDGRLSGPHHL